MVLERAFFKNKEKSKEILILYKCHKKKRKKSTVDYQHSSVLHSMQP